jgi:hypothetical protein
MAIADEVKDYARPRGNPCTVWTMGQAHPDLYAQLMEALATEEFASTVARWWNDTRAEESGLRISGDNVQRHRTKECTWCR